MCVVCVCVCVGGGGGQVIPPHGALWEQWSIHWLTWLVGIVSIIRYAFWTLSVVGESCSLKDLQKGQTGKRPVHSKAVRQAVRSAKDQKKPWTTGKNTSAPYSTSLVMCLRKYWMMFHNFLFGKTWMHLHQKGKWWSTEFHYWEHVWWQEWNSSWDAEVL